MDVPCAGKGKVGFRFTITVTRYDGVLFSMVQGGKEGKRKNSEFGGKIYVLVTDGERREICWQGRCGVSCFGGSESSAISSGNAV